EDAVRWCWTGSATRPRRVRWSGRRWGGLPTWGTEGCPDIVAAVGPTPTPPRHRGGGEAPPTESGPEATARAGGESAVREGEGAGPHDRERARCCGQGRAERRDRRAGVRRDRVRNVVPRAGVRSDGVRNVMSQERVCAATGARCRDPRAGRAPRSEREMPLRGRGNT